MIIFLRDDMMADSVKNPNQKLIKDRLQNI